MNIVQHLRGTTAWNVAHTFPASVLTYDTDLNQYRVHDGVTAGGWPIPKTADIGAIATLEFVGLNTKSVPATPWGVGDIDDLNEITVAGVYTLPAAALFGTGHAILVKSIVAGSTIQCAGADQILDYGATVTSLALTQYETVKIAKRPTGVVFQVMSRY